MNKIQIKRAASLTGSIDNLGWAMSVGAAMITLTLIALGVSANDVGAKQPQASTTAAAPAERTAAEMDWNLREDSKASRYLGQPGIY